MANKDELYEIVEMVHAVILHTKQHNLTAEVMASALQILKNSPEMDIEEALKSALEEWDI